MMMKRLMKIQIILVFVLLAVCLFGCSKQSEESSESVTQKDAGTDSYMTVTVNADFQFYEENYPGHWACFYHPEFYMDKDCNSELMDISMDSIDSTIKYKIQAPEGLSEVFIVLPVIRIVEDIKPVTVKINEASDTEFNGFSIAGIGIPQLVEWKSTDTIFEIVVAIQSESDCFPAHLRMSILGRPSMKVWRLQPRHPLPPLMISSAFPHRWPRRHCLMRSRPYIINIRVSM